MDQPEVCAEVPRRVRRGPRVQAGRVVAAGREELSKRRGGGAHPTRDWFVTFSAGRCSTKLAAPSLPAALGSGPHSSQVESR